MEQEQLERQAERTDTGDRLLRLPQVLEIIPCSKAHWYDGMKQGKYPQPVKLGRKFVAWKESEIRALLEG